MKKLAIATIAAAVAALALSLPSARAQGTLNPQGVLKPDAFADVPPDHWAYNAVEFLRQNGLTEGYPDRTYKGKRPMTRYEFAQVIQRMVNGLTKYIDAHIPQPGPAGVSQADLDALAQRIPTEEQIRAWVRDELARNQQAPEVTRQQFEALQRLVNEFKDELAKLGTDVDAVKKDLADLRSRVEAVEAELARLPRISGVANIIFKSSAVSPQVRDAATGALRPVFDHDGRPMKPSTNLLGSAPSGAPSALDYYDLDLGIMARPSSDVRVGAVLNIGNYLPSYTAAGGLHGYGVEPPTAVTPYKVFINVPFKFLGSNELTLGRQGTQLTPYTFKAIDPDTYTYLPREDSGEVVFWGANTTWHFGSAKVRAFAGINPLDGRLLPLNVFGEFNLPATFGTAPGTTFGGTPVGFAGTGGLATGGAPIGSIGNFAGARLTFGEPDVSPLVAAELPVGTAEQLNLPAKAAGVQPTATGEGGAAEPAVEETPEVESGINFGPFKNVTLGLNWLMAAGRGPRVFPGGEDARGQVYGADARFKLLNLFKVESEVGFGETNGIAFGAPRRALRATAIDTRGFFTLGLGSFADLDIGGGWRRVPIGYLVPGYWGTIGSWKNPRGIEGPLAEVRIPLKWQLASFFRNVTLKALGEWYDGAENLATVGTTAATDPAETNMHLDHYLAGLQFALTSRNTVDLGFEQVFRNYVPARAGDAPLSLPTGGIDGSPLVGTRIKNTETYLNFGIGHNFTSDIAVKLLYQIVDFAKYAVDRSNQPANYRGYVATAQVGVRF